jgi:hypothetical protein
VFEYYRVDLDAKDLEKRINAFDLSMKSTARKLIARVATGIRRDSRRKARSQSNRTGKLAKSIGYKAFNDFSALVFARVYYASFLEKGVTIRPRNPAKRKYLVFRIDGEWKKVESVTLEPRPFLKPVIDDYFKTGKAEKIMEEALQKALDNKLGKET